MPALTAPTITAPAAPASASASGSGSASKDAEHRLVLDHLGLAEAIAHRFSGAAPDWLDIRQVAYLGLVTAARRFDASLGHDFVSFASPTITGAIKHHLRDHGWFVRPPRAVQELHSAIIATIPALTQQLGRHPDTWDLAAALERSHLEVTEAVASSSAFHPLSLDLEHRGPIDASTGRSGPTPLHETIGAPDGAYDRVDAGIWLDQICSALPERERRALLLRLVLNRSQTEIAAELGISQMHVSRILARTLARLRRTGPAQDPAAVPETVPGS